MAYTAPAGNAANFTWQGQSAYAPPSGSAANFSFAAGSTGSTGSATGFSSASFGAPTNRRTQAAAGFSSTQFGAPKSPINAIAAATGFKAGSMGSPTHRRTQAAAGSSTTVLGSPTSSTATAPTNVTGVQQPFNGVAPTTYLSDDFNSGATNNTRPMGIAGSPSKTWTGVSSGGSITSGVFSKGASSLALEAYNVPDMPSTWEATFVVAYSATTTPQTFAYNLEWTNGGTWSGQESIYGDVKFSTGAATLYVQDQYGNTTQSLSTTLAAITALTAGASHTVKVRRTATTVTLYVDGTLLLTGSIPSNWVHSPDYIFLNNIGVGIDQATITTLGYSLPVTQFGTPQFVAPSAVKAASTIGQVTTFGTPALTTIGQATTIGEVAQIPMAYHPFTQVGQAQGFRRTGYGWPWHFVGAQITTHNTCAASGVQVTSFGSASTAAVAATSASGWQVIALGLARASLGRTTTGVQSTAFGTPTIRLARKAQGSDTTVFGTAHTSGTQPVTSTAPKTQFGTPKAQRPNVHLARGYCTTRFAVPKASKVFGHPATGWVGTHISHPVSFNRLKALHTAPACRFGNPAARRLVC